MKYKCTDFIVVGPTNSTSRLSKFLAERVNYSC